MVLFWVTLQEWHRWPLDHLFEHQYTLRLLSFVWSCKSKKQGWWGVTENQVVCVYIFIYLYTYRMDSVSIDIYIRATFVFWGVGSRCVIEDEATLFQCQVRSSSNFYLYLHIYTYPALENIWFSERIGPSQVLCIEIWRSFICQLAIPDHMRWNKGPLPGPAPRIRSWHSGFVVALRTLVPWFKAWSLVDRRLNFFEYHPCTASIRYG